MPQEVRDILEKLGVVRGLQGKGLKAKEARVEMIVKVLTDLIIMNAASTVKTFYEELPVEKKFEVLKKIVGLAASAFEVAMGEVEQVLRNKRIQMEMIQGVYDKLVKDIAEMERERTEVLR